MNPSAETAAVEEAAAQEEEGHMNHQRHLARAESGLGDSEGNPLGVQG